MKAIIFNSGLGSRMGRLTSNKPKCMVELYNGESIFERQIRILNECGIKEFIVTTGPYKEQLIDIANKFNNIKFEFVHNPEYKNTNYIVSMNNANRLLDDDILLLHGDLVFNRDLVKKMINSEKKSVCLYNEKRELPQKDFKARFCNNILKEVSISIFDENCYAFQPFYKLSKNDIYMWKSKVSEFVKKGNINVYAENALNEISNEISISGMSYKDDYIEEIDNEEDYIKVSDEIKYFDYKEQHVEITNSYIESLKNNLQLNDNIFIVCSKKFSSEIFDKLKKYNITLFSEYTPNPKYEDIKKGIDLFRKKDYKIIISVGGGSTIDVAKCIKIFSVQKNEYDFLDKKYTYNRIKHIAIPTTAGTGSESTQIAVMYYNGEKISIDHGSILPNIAILDYTLLRMLPEYQKKSTLLDSICQAIESYWSKSANNQSKKYSRKCISLILENYERYIKNDEKALKKIILASNYSGKAINISRTTAAHAMSYKITDTYGISHGHAVALCIIPIWRLLLEKSKNDKKLNNILLEIARLFGANNIIESINKFDSILNEFDLPKINIKDEDIQMLVNTINIERMKNNPVNFTSNEIYKLYKEIKKKERVKMKKRDRL